VHHARSHGPLEYTKKMGVAVAVLIVCGSGLRDYPIIQNGG
jgi:hypothetical protein